MPINIDHDRVEFLGIEIIFTEQDDPRGSVWIPFSESVSLLYGKNGSGKSTIIKAISSFIAGHSLEEEGILVHGYVRPIDDSRTCSIIDQAVKSMPETGFLNDLEDLDQSEIEQKFLAMATELEFPHSRWETSLFSAVPESIDDLDMDWNKFVSHFLFLGLWDQDIRHDITPLKGFISHLVTEQILCLRASGKNDIPEWKLTLAASVDNNEVRDAYEKLLDEPEILDDDEEPENYVGQILIDANILANRSRMPRTNSPFLSAAAMTSQTVLIVDLNIVNLNEEIDLVEWTKARVSEIIYSSWINIVDPWFSDYPSRQTPTSAFSPNYSSGADEDDFDEEKFQSLWNASFGSREIPIGRTIDFELESDRRDTLQRVLTFIAKELPSELAISDLRIKFETDLGLWIYGNPATLEAFDQRSRTWIPVSETSSATQRIIGMALRIHSDIRSIDKTTIAVGDELDSGLHSLAITSLYQMLNTSIPTCFLTSHSAVALSSPFGERIHVQRGILGEILFGSLNVADFGATSANSLGIKVSELIGTVELVIAVEGLHDKLVFEHFIKRDSRFDHSNILIISMTGINNASNLLDSEFLLSYTDLRILAIADNASKTDLTSTLNEVLKKIRNHESPRKVAAGLRRRAVELKNQRWHEQYCMVELLALATDRKLLQRIRVSGHTYFDIQAALNPALFNLDKSWLELEAEYKEKRQTSASGRFTFKDYLREEYGVSIDRKTIETALQMTFETPTEIQLVLDDIVEVLDEPTWSSFRL